MKRFPFVLISVFWLGGMPAAAQERAPDAELPPEIAERVVEFYNDARTTRLSGDSRVPAEAEIVGGVAVLDGSLVLAGRIRGPVVVINGDAVLEPGAVIDGELIVVGGAIEGADHAQIAGTTSQYDAPLRYAHAGTGELTYVRPAMQPALVAGREFGFGRTDLRIALNGAYNRVEGLPVAIGPSVSIGRSNPTWLDASLIFRSEAGLDRDDFGYALRAEQYVGGHLAARVGATLHSEIQPIEPWEVSDRESSLSTFLLHRDFRDHYERRGWSVYVRVAPRREPHELTFAYYDERHESLAAEEPWSLTGNDQRWRAQPLIAEGSLRTVAARWRFDTRNEPGAPAHGWLIRGEVEQALGGSLVSPVRIDDNEPVHETAATDRSFTAMSLDLRRYARTGPYSRIALRLLAAGSIDGGSLPPQRQHVLGGAGSLPAYDLFNFDCGARGDTVHLRGNAFYPYYGCDRAVLVQLEYHASLNLGRSLGRRLGIDVDLGDTPGIVVFFDAGRAWTESDARQGRSGGLDDFKADAGFGVRLGRLGAYWAVPLSGRADRVNFFVRVGPRI